MAGSQPCSQQLTEQVHARTLGPRRSSSQTGWKDMPSLLCQHRNPTSSQAQTCSPLPYLQVGGCSQPSWPGPNDNDSALRPLVAWLGPLLGVSSHLGQGGVRVRSPPAHIGDHLCHLHPTPWLSTPAVHAILTKPWSD